MKKHILSLNTVAASAVYAAFTMAGITGHAQTPVFTSQPQNQLVQPGQQVTFSVTTSEPCSYQWLLNGSPIEGETNSSFTIESVQIENGGYYSCTATAANGSSALDVAQSSTAFLETFILPPGDFIVVYALPITSNGGSGNCPGPYKGYVNYLPTNNWGFVTNSLTTNYVAADNNRTNTKIEYGGDYGDAGCAKTTVTIPYPAGSPYYRFSIYFTNSVPTTNYPITLTGFSD